MNKIRLNEFHEQVKSDLASLVLNASERGQIRRNYVDDEIVEKLTIATLAFSGKHFDLESSLDLMKSGKASRDFELEYIRVRDSMVSLIVDIIGSGQKIQYEMKGSLDTGFIEKIEM